MPVFAGLELPAGISQTLEIALGSNHSSKACAQTYPQVVLRLTVAFREDEEVARREWIVAEQAKAHGIALFFHEQGAVEYQPQFQGAAEQVAHPFEVADFGQALPAGDLKGSPVWRAAQRELLECGQVAAIRLEGLVQPGHRQRWGGQVIITLALLALQQVEAQATGHRGVALAAHAGAGGDGFTQWQAEVVQRKL